MPASSNFYLETKGEAETGDCGDSISNRLDILHPGLLTGGARKESRMGESVGILLVSPLYRPVDDGVRCRNIRSTPSAKVAQAIVTLALGGGYGQYIHENDAISALAG